MPERKVKEAISVESLRKVTVVIRQALRAENTAQRRSYDDGTIRSYLKKLTFRWGDSSRFTSVGKDIEPSPLSVDKLIRIIDLAVKDHITNPEQKRLWAEFCRTMTTVGKFDPFVQLV